LLLHLDVSEAMSLSVNFKLSGAGNSFLLDLEPSVTILALKTLLTETTKLDPAQMKLIFKGRILKDDDTLESTKVESGQSMHVVKSAASAPTAGATTTAAPSAASVDASVGANPLTAGAGAANPMAAMMGGAGGANPMAAMMQDPAMMQAAMQMMGGMGGGGAPGAVAPGGANPMAAMMGGGAAPTPSRCACGNFDSGRGDGLCNSCRNNSATQSPS